MTALLDWICGPNAELLCLALLHSLWQGAAWCALLLVVLRRIPSTHPQARYAIALTCLYGLLGGACLTWSILRQAIPSSEVQTTKLASIAENDVPNGSTAPLAVPSTGNEVTKLAPAVSLAAAFPFEIATLAPWIVSIWLTGACLCLLMSSRHIAAVQRLQAGKPIGDPEANRLLGKLVAMLGISRAVQLLSVENLAVPGVIGVLKPAILIPCSLVTGLAPDQWEAILAHELAHIRRWDYLVNLSQLVIESMLFFNPAVWRLSRHVRLEREACCDAVAVKATSQPFEYASLLVNLAERLHPNADAAVAPAVGFSREQSGSLLERVRRIVTPGGRSELTMNRPTAVMFLVLGLAAVVLLQAGADVAVNVAARILSDEERVAELADTAREVKRESGDRITIQGTIQFEGELPPRQYVTIHANSRRGMNTSGSTLETVDLAKTTEFSETIGPGITCLQFGHPDFAETQIGPFGAGDAPGVSGIRVVLKRGIDVPVEILDPKGNPVPDARISAIPQSPVGGGGSTFRKAPTTDENGQAVLKHINPELEYSLYLTASGYQAVNPPTNKLSAGSPLRLEMVQAKSTSGIVVNEHGQPIAGATLKRFRFRRPKMTNTRGGSERPMATTDAQGKFLLTELEDTWTYDLLVEADGHAPTILADVDPGETDLRTTMKPAIIVQGSVHGSARHLENLKTARGLKWSLHFPRQTTDPSLDRLRIGGWQKIDLADGIGRFTLPPLARGELIVELDDLLIQKDLTASLDDLKIDLSEDASRDSPDMPAKRLVRITFTRDGEPVSPEGEMRISSRWPGEDAHTRRPYPINDGKVEAEFYVGYHLMFGCGEMIGFWFGHHPPSEKLASGTDPLEIVIPVHPAGAVKGIVVDAAGAPVADAGASVRYELAYRDSGNLTSHGSGCNARTNEKGEFFLSPIPFGAECSVRASRGKYVALGGEFSVNAENTLPSFTITLDQGVDARLRLLAPSGAPLVGQSVQLSCRHPLVSQSWGPPELTDRHGECRFQQLNPAFKGHYMVDLDFDKDYVPAETPLDLDGETTVFRLQRGKVVEGTLVDSQGRPLAGVQLRAHCKPAGRLLRYLPEAKTDPQGRFHFSNLPNTRMEIREDTWTKVGTFVTPADPESVKPVTVRKPD